MLGKKNLNFATALFLVFWLIKEKLRIYTIPSQTFLSDRRQKSKYFFMAPDPLIFCFWRNRKFTFLQRCLQPLYFFQSPHLPVKSSILHFYPLVQQSSKNKRKKRGCCEQSSMVDDVIETKSTSLRDTRNTSRFNSHRD